MITHNQNDVLAVQPLSILGWIATSKTKVPKVIEHIVCLYLCIDSIKYRLIHLFNCRKGSIAVFDDVGVSEVSITCKKCSHEPAIVSPLQPRVIFAHYRCSCHAKTSLMMPRLLLPPTALTSTQKNAILARSICMN